MNKQKTVIALKNLSVSYGAHHILRDITVDIPAHVIMAVIGPNGSGKTTFLKILLGLITPDKGTVRIFGKSPKAVRNRVAYVPQRFSFDQSMPITVSEFLVLSVADSTTKDHAEALEHFKITHLKDAVLGILSGGQLQRVLLARAFLQKPDILYLDEPEAGIDIGGEQDFYTLIKHLHDKHNMTIIFVSHEVDIVSHHATHVLCLSHQNFCFGNPQNVLNTKVLSDLYGTEVNFFNHNHKK